MGAGRDLDVFGDLAVTGDPAVMRPIQPDDLGQQMRIAQGADATSTTATTKKRPGSTATTRKMITRTR